MSSGKLRPHRKVRITDNIPESEWCDARAAYLLADKTVQEIADEQGCEARAISRLIRENRSFSELGKKRTPSMVDGFQDTIEQMLRSESFADMRQITIVSKHLLEMIGPLGYQGSERTLRDYLKSIPWLEWVTEDG